MERDPVRFVWRAAPGLNIALIVVALFALACFWAGLDLVRSALDDAVLGLPFSNGQSTAPFFRFAIALHERLSETPLVLVPGIRLGREALVVAAAVALVAAALIVGMLAALIGRLESGIGNRAGAALSARVLEGIAFAPISATEAARQSADMAGRALAGERRFLGSVVGAPVLAGGIALLAVAFAARLDLWLGLVALLGIAACAAAGSWRDTADIRLALSDTAAGERLRRAFAGLAGHLSALAAHGTAAAEQRRIADDLAGAGGPAQAVEASSIRARGLFAAAACLPPAAVLAAAVSFGEGSGITPGSAVAAAAATAAAAGAVAALGEWRAGLARTRPVFAELARQLGSFQSRRRTGTAVELPRSGKLVAEGVSVDTSARDERLLGLDLSVALPSHVAFTGEPGSGARAFAALLGAQRLPRAGHITLGGVDILAAGATDRAKKLAYAGGDTLLLSHTLRANLLYGCPDVDAPDIDDRLRSATKAAGLDSLIEARGLSATVDPRREPTIADAMVSARASVRRALEESRLLDLVQPFEPGLYNPQATIGENILFGVPLGDTFRDEHLPAHSFMRGLLAREGLDKALGALGAAIVRSTLEMFGGLPEGSPIVGRFSIFAAQERDGYERLLDRQGRGHRGTAASRDAERLIALALRYSETRHRLGLLGPELQNKLLALRKAFAENLPKSLEPAVEFFHADRLCVSASVLDNLLFGRIAKDRAAARRDVLAVLRRVLADLGLADDLFRIGLSTRVDPRETGLTSAETAAIDLVRCLVRQPDNLVVERAFDDLPGKEAQRLLASLATAMAGRGLIAVLPTHLSSASMDRTVVFEAGRAVREGEPTHVQERGPAALVS